MFKRTPPFRGAGLFGDSAAEAKPAAAPVHRANIDGASRGNPGPAAYGVVIHDSRGQVVAKIKKYIGRATNNVAEYYGLIAALDYAQSHAIRALRVESDSELLVRQMRGQYKVKSPELRPLYERARKVSQSLESFRIEHVYREQNALADALANDALDETSGGPRNSPARTNEDNRPALPQTARSPEDKRATRTFRVRYHNGALHPLEPLNLPDNAEVEIVIRPVRKN
jgi:ribonuclease HI